MLLISKCAFYLAISEFGARKTNIAIHIANAPYRNCDILFLISGPAYNMCGDTPCIGRRYSDLKPRIDEDRQYLAVLPADTRRNKSLNARI